MGRHTLFRDKVFALHHLLYALSMITLLPAAATEIWDGPLTTFDKPDGADSLQPVNQDRITPNVRLTRDTLMGMYNIAVETGYAHFVSPADTEWAFGSLANYNSLAFANWETWNGQNPPEMVGQDAVLHLISDDIYMSLRYTYWGGALGGFTYERSTPAVPEPSGAIILLVGLTILCAVKGSSRRSFEKPISHVTQNFTD